jgi:hypothetical protein
MRAVASNRWEVTDASGGVHVVAVHKGLFGTPTLRIDGHRQILNLRGEGIVAFEVAGRQARLSPQPGGTGYEFSVGSLSALPPTIADPTLAATVAPASGTTTAKLVQQRDGGASWFYWIGALTLVNTLLFLFGSEYGFASGLGFTLFIAVAVDVFSEGSLLWLAVLLDLPLVAALFWLGSRAKRGAIWPFVVGGILYTLDLFLVLSIADWIGVAIHAFALFSFFAGWKAARALRRLEVATA